MNPLIYQNFKIKITRKIRKSLCKNERRIKMRNIQNNSKKNDGNVKFLTRFKGLKMST